MTNPWHCDRVMALVAVVCLGAAPVTAQSAKAKREPDVRSPTYEGRRLSDALGALQARGLRIVFSSEIVTPEMRVVAEPRATTPRQVLDELLKSHGLTAEDGPAGVVLVVRRRPAGPIEPRKRPSTTETPIGPPAPDAVTYSERVIVTAPQFGGEDRGVGSQVRLGRADLQSSREALADDPMRAVQSLPRVAASDDFRSDFSVRGSPYRHIGVVIDGVATPWLQHTAFGRSDAGSITMLNSDALEQATLQAGAYPQRYGDRIGAQLGLTLRQGSRFATGLRGSISGTSAALVAEGPFGRSQRGSWLVTLRRSYLDWPIRRQHALDGAAFGFTDAQTKLVYDVRRGQQVSVSVLAGQSRVDGADGRGPADLGNGTNRAAVVNLRWRSTFGSGIVLTQQAHLVTHAFVNERKAAEDAARGANEERSYRADLIRALPGGLIEAGGQIRRTHASRRFREFGEPAAAALRNGFDGTAWLPSGYVNYQWTPTERLTITPGIRVAHSTLAARPAVGRWIMGEWSFRSHWTLNASTGVSHQFPEFEQVLGSAAALAPKAEQATHAEIGIERSLARSIRVRAALFTRDERGVLRQPDTTPRIAADTLLEPTGPARYENALSGASRGVELLLERRSVRGLSGWIAYSYGRNRQTDAERKETFWGDFDQRHAIKLSALYSLPDRTSVAIKFRGGTNFPIPGYLAVRDGALYAGSRRNEVRLPGYARLDARAERSFDYGRRRFTVFVEVLNVLNRTNVGLADGVVTRATGRATGFTVPLFPRLPSAGLRIDF